MRLSIIVPTLNPGLLWDSFLAGLLMNLEDLKLPKSRVLIVDSSSDDGTFTKARQAGFTALSIARTEFDHGGTRQRMVERETGAEVLVFLTQDAILVEPDSIRKLLRAFADPRVGAAYGRQLPRRGAGAIESHARLFNYPEVSSVRSIDDAPAMGFKSVFSSNAFCAFRRSALTEVGGFCLHAIASEETIAIAAMHLAGWRSAYVAEAMVYHSHAYTVAQEFRRYFDVGVTQARNPVLTEVFGIARGDGKRFVLSELRYLLRHRPAELPSALLRTVTKLAGYRLGRREARLSPAMRRRLSMNPGFWLAEELALQPEADALVASGLARWDRNAELLAAVRSRRDKPVLLPRLPAIDPAMLHIARAHDANATGGHRSAAGGD